MKEKLIELMKEKGFYNRNEGIIELEECDVEIMAEAIIELYNLQNVGNNEVAFCDWWLHNTQIEADGYCHRCKSDKLQDQTD